MEKALDKMRRLCSRREYCVSDIRIKLMRLLEGDAGKVECALKTLIEEKYVSDLRYATAFARDKASLAGWGVTKIRYMLSSKGVPRDIIDRALAEVDDENAKSRLEKLMENKFKSLKDDPQCRMKMLRFGLGRGYAYEEVAEVTDCLMKKDRLI